MLFFWLKALHIIFVVTWFAGLFYIVRLFIYHTEAEQKPEPEKSILQNQFKIMEKRLWYGITWPSLILTWIFGLSVAYAGGYFADFGAHGWLHVKLLFVLLLTVYHFICGNILSNLHKSIFKLSSTALRIWNEIATVFLVAIVVLVVLRNLLDLAYAMIGLVAFSGVLMIAVFTYKKVRARKG
jgi:protoporphyrinogen IX oxidase